MRRVVASVLMIALSVSAQALAALDEPSVEVLAKQLGARIPPYWTVSDVRITASANAGDEVEPRIKQRFEATVTPRSALYLEDADSSDALRPYIPVVATITAEESRTLYGIAESTYGAGEWSSTVELENGVANVGMPKSMFAGPTVILGSEREASIRERLRPDTAQKVKRQLQAEVEQQRTRHESELRAKEAAHAKAMDGLKAQYAAEMRDVVEELKRQQASQSGELARIKQQQRVELQNLKLAEQAKLEQVKTSHQAALKDLKARQQSELTRITQSQASALEHVQREHTQNMERIKLEHEQKVALLRQQIKGTGELVALQEKKKERELALADARRKVLEAKAATHRELLAEFREVIAAEDKDSRRAAFQVAFNDGNELLRQTAVTVGLESDDPVLRKVAVKAGLDNGDEAIQRLALKAGLTSTQLTDRRLALKEALSSDNHGLQEMALRYVFSDLDTVPVRLEAFDERQSRNLLGRLGALSLEIKEFNEIDGRLAGVFRNGWLNVKNRPFRGQVSGDNLSLASALCRLNVSLQEKANMVGELHCGAKGSVKASIALQ